MRTSDSSLPPIGPSIRKAFEALVTTFEERGVQYALIGGLALLQHGRVRATEHVDVLVSIPQIALPGLQEALSKRGFQVDLAMNSRELIQDGMTAVRLDGVRVDLLRPVIPAAAHALKTAQAREILNRRVPVVTAEALIVLKFMAFRAQDLADIRDILAAYDRRLDVDLIRRELATFTQADDDRRRAFEALVAAQ